jgi:hypothetical protein
MNAVNRALKSETACYSFKGNDFRECESGTKGRRLSKKITNRSRRAVDKALVREA